MMAHLHKGKPLKAVWLRLSPCSQGPLRVVARSDELISPDASGWQADPVLEACPPRGRVPVLLLHPDDAVLLTLQPPPVAARHRQAALEAMVESLWPGPLSELVCRFSAPNSQGQVMASLFPTRVLACLQRLLEELPPAWRSSLRVLPLDACTAPGPVPAWVPEQAGQSTRYYHWLAWIALWLALLSAGLGLDAWRHEQAADTLRSSIEAEFRRAFPQVPVVLDPVAQARRLMRAGTSDGPDSGTRLADLLARMAQQEPRLAGRITAITWRDGSWSFTLTEAMEAAPALQQTLRDAGWQWRADGEVWTLTQAGAR
jgi:general secretion pathway protein L